MQVDQFLLDILVCPDTKERVELLSAASLKVLNNLIHEGKIKNRAGVLVQESLDAALLRSDRQMVYPVRRGIPVMLVEEGLPVEGISLVE
jgi:uncharacterized protein YbaR (Trm112 family)